ncbi:MAG: 16S rRNA (guanine(527)-N(7))-methyltransferase RsmG [Treponema sp.]|nr:MAG: 16S rRNA (guanine(527)-N(7))-methyltransferase RsmG [Treponema sp.]
MKNNELILRGLHKLNLDNDEQTNALINLIQGYLQEIMTFNQKFNLIGDKRAEDIIIKHIFDSLAGFYKFKETVSQKKGALKIADMGSGAGLPGIPLAIAFKSIDLPVKITLIERMKKRCTFLHNVKAVLNLNHIEIQEEDIKNVKNHFDIVTCRAFTTLTPAILNKMKNITTASGKIILYKGNIQKTENELEKISSYLNIPFKYKIEPITTPLLNAERCLAIISP